MELASATAIWQKYKLSRLEFYGKKPSDYQKKRKRPSSWLKKGKNAQPGEEDCDPQQRSKLNH